MRLTDFRFAIEVLAWLDASRLCLNLACAARVVRKGAESAAKSLVSEQREIFALLPVADLGVEPVQLRPFQPQPIVHEIIAQTMSQTRAGV